MPRKDVMTSRERFVTALTGKPYDRIPVFLLMGTHAGRVTVGEYQNPAALVAEGQANSGTPIHRRPGFQVNWLLCAHSEMRHLCSVDRPCTLSPDLTKMRFYERLASINTLKYMEKRQGRPFA
jgi:hypothetical protein